MDKKLNFEIIITLLSKMDQWISNNFGISLSLADNVEQLAVVIITFTMLAVLFFLTLGNRTQKNKAFDADVKETTEHKTSPTLKKGRSANLESNSLNDKGNQTNSIKENAHPINLNNDNEISNKPKIVELDNGFVINKRHSDLREMNKTDRITDKKQAGLVENAKEDDAASSTVEIANDKKFHLADALLEIEAEMLGIRKEYKSGNISSMDYLSKTQDLYNKSEELVVNDRSLNE